MYRTAQIHVRVNGTFSDDFLVLVQLDQGSVLSPLLFVIALSITSIYQILSMEIRLIGPNNEEEDLLAITWHY